MYYQEPYSSTTLRGLHEDNSGGSTRTRRTVPPMTAQYTPPPAQEASITPIAIMALVLGAAGGMAIRDTTRRA